MNFTVKLNKQGTMGELHLGTDAQAHEKLEGVPGLRLMPGVAHGTVDALAAACRILGIAPPVQRGTVPVVVERKGLRDYQLQGVAWLVNTLTRHGGAILADEPGLGKTLQALETMRALAEDQRCLVVCPAAARETWREELAKWGFDSACVLSPTARKAEWAKAPEARIVITSYDHRMVAKTMEVAFPYDQPGFLVMDEAHRVRGRSSFRSKALAQVAALVPYKLALTATPQYDRPRDFYQLLATLLGHRFGSRFDFDRRYCGWVGYTQGGDGLNTGATNLEELRTRIGYYMLRREKKDVARELPPLTRQVRWVDGTKEAKAAFHILQMGLKRANTIDAIKATLRGKAEEALLLAKEAGKFLLLTWLREHAAQFHKALLDDGVPNVHIDGGLSTEERALRIQEARAKGWGVVATLDSCAESLNLQGLASTLIIHAIDWVPMKLVQAEGRLHRLGTHDPVNVIYIAMRDSVDVLTVQTVVNKLDTLGETMGKGNVRGLRHALGDNVDGAGAAETEKKVLASMYEALKGMKVDDDD